MVKIHPNYGLLEEIEDIPAEEHLSKFEILKKLKTETVQWFLQPTADTPKVLGLIPG
jgi:hypothetical protein